MEVWGGNGYVETGPMARLYREAPVNSIWEGSGNVMCLDVLRAIGRDPEGTMLLLQDIQEAAAGHAGRLALVGRLRRDLQAAPEEQEVLARRLAQRLVLAAQAALMLRHALPDVAEAFAASRLDAEGGWAYGSMTGAVLQQRILDRAWPTGLIS